MQSDARICFWGYSKMHFIWYQFALEAQFLVQWLEITFSLQYLIIYLSLSSQGNGVLIKITPRSALVMFQQVFI
jgi:hypothetical protein